MLGETGVSPVRNSQLLELQHNLEKEKRLRKPKHAVERYFARSKMTRSTLIVSNLLQF